MRNCGIYIIKNKINQKVYIGQSVDIKCRWYSHYSSGAGNCSDSHTALHQAMYDLGRENFYYEIIEECDHTKLNEQETYWITYYNSVVPNGYNMNYGGDALSQGENNGRSILTESQVTEIRLMYNAHIPFRDAWERYKDTGISKRGFQKVWHFETWKHILPEVYTDENRKWHRTFSKKVALNEKSHVGNNQQRACSEKEIAYIRKLRAEGKTYKEIHKITGRSTSVIGKYCNFQECTSPDKNGWSKQIKNVETGLVFVSQSAGARWANCSPRLVSANKNTNKSAGIVPSTNEPAHWISL